MAFVKVSGKSRVEYYPKAASEAFEVDDLVYFNGSGQITKADSTSGDHIGVIKKKVTSADSDYASTTMVPVEVIEDNDIYEVDVDSGTALTTAMVGNRYDLADEASINVGATSKKVVTVVGFISATKALVKVNAIIQNADVATS